MGTAIEKERKSMQFHAKITMQNEKKHGRTKISVLFCRQIRDEQFTTIPYDFFFFFFVIVLRQLGFHHNQLIRINKWNCGLDLCVMCGAEQAQFDVKCTFAYAPACFFYEIPINCAQFHCH